MIRLGDIHIKTFKKGKGLYPSWMKNDLDYAEEVANTLPKAVILPPNKTYTLTIDYPLSTPAKFTVTTGKRGLTREAFVLKVCKFYKDIYDAEDSSSTFKARLGKDGGAAPMMNREASDGKYGIWGHVLGDLILCTLYVNGNKLTLGVDS